MADNKQSNDEYQIPDLEGYEEKTYDEAAYDTDTSRSSKGSFFKDNPVVTKAAVVIALAVMLMLAYKFLGPLFMHEKPTPVSSIPDMATVAPSPTPPVPPLEPSPAAPPAPTPAPSTDEISQKVATLEVTQQSMRNRIEDLSEKLSAASGNMEDISQHFSEINQQMQRIMDKLDKQAQEMHRLRVKGKPPVKVKRPQPKVPSVTWNVQAAIPGRAWLIASNGSTLTVRKGSKVPGLGNVRVIDAQQGRIMMSSGRIITFSMQDS